MINVVFLMLIFFLVAGTIAPPVDPNVALAATQKAPQSPPLAALLLDAEGQASWHGTPITLDAFVQNHAPREDEPLRLGADRDLPADMLIDVLGQLRALGIADIVLVTERQV
ncbi:hypothetical protein GCM10011499_29620 [Pelagibacterium lentulum]|uniref:Biopolymer transporter ExbD n=1 Tax=Pelagibacterium lentulum TaxID=2029865 RepID=A0A916RIN5_9HYPH|nr:hypothetical protein GCM10011499_29620 [Pelagibacterium lentulum]